MPARIHSDPDTSVQPVGDTLREVFGFDSFRPHQLEILEAILAGRDAFAALPTGGGKSLCYQLPSLLLPHLTVVVSPLIALMQDQVDGARANGLAAAFLNSTLDPATAAEVRHGLARGTVRLLYVSPERMASESFREQLRSYGVSLFAIDEAHCISEWGHEFRPDYRSLSVLRDEFPRTPVSAFTATATRVVQDDVIRLLGLRTPLAIRGDFDRPEISYRVVRKERLADQILSVVRAHRDEPGIVYRATRKSAEQTAARLAGAGIRAVVYHAGLSDEDRRVNQSRFVRDEVQVVVATIAFGMGIDKSNVRWIVHGDLPRSLEAYYQESGRAGRDGEPAEACLFYGPQDIMSVRYHIDRLTNEQERERAGHSLQEMIRYADSGICRRIRLLAHFDQRHTGNCGGCDVCTGEVETSNETVAAQMAMSAMVRTGQRFGAHHIADIVIGDASERVLQFGHDRLPTYGVGRDHPRRWWIALIRDLEAGGLVGRTDGARSGLALCASGREVLAGRQQFHTAKRPDEPAATARPAAPTGEAVDETLFDALRTARTGLARSRGVPPYVVFSDRTLRHMASACPRTRDELLGIHGVGDHKAATYGEVFLQVIRDAAGSSGAGEDSGAAES